ncbi:MAG: hypothetical protein KDE33_21930, partial [Bacteroidetes bacterium]|nr:hypothetical protein [Bacteroidota bacterium]
CVVTEDGYVITHPRDFLAAITNGLQKFEVVVMKNAILNDVIDFISFKHVWQHGKSKRKMYEMVKVLTEFVVQQDKEWKKKFKSNKTRAIIAELTGVSDGTIQGITSIGKMNPQLLDDIDNNKIKNATALQIGKKKKEKSSDGKFTSRKRHASIKISNTSNYDSGEKALLNVTSATFEVENVGTVKFIINGKSSTLTINGKHISDAIHNVVSDNDFEGKRDYSQHHTLLPNDDSFDVQFIMKGIEKYITNQIKIAA